MLIGTRSGVSASRPSIASDRAGRTGLMARREHGSSTFSVGHPPDRSKTVVRPLLTELEKPNLSRSYKQAGPTGLGLPAVPSGGPAHRQSLRKPRQGRPVCRKLAPKFPMSSVGAACSEPGSSKIG